MLDPAVAAVRCAVRQNLADLPPGALVLVGLSGGPDSCALAAATRHVATRAELLAGAVVVDHGLQPDSADRAGTVAGWATGIGLAPVLVRPVDVGTAGGPEAAARTARHAALAAAAAETGAAAVLLGHTRDDQAETVLLGLARGSGARSLAGMSARAGRLRRPLLGLGRELTVAACHALGIAYWEDPQNADPAFARARVRADALPALERALGPGVPAALARTADQLRADADALDEWAARCYPVLVPDGSVDAVALAAEPAAIRGRVVHRALLAAGVPAGALSHAHVTAVLALATDWHGQSAVSLPGGLVARRRCGRLVIDADEPAPDGRVPASRRGPRADLARGDRRPHR
jgi:tRNA(Ile)-lysidine synthase